MRVAMLGSGRAGRTLGLGFIAHGHEVVMGTRNPNAQSVQAWLAEAGDAATATTYAEAAARCEIAVFVPTWAGAASAATLTGASNVAGKVVIDVTNPLGTLEDGSSGLVVGGDDSAAEQVQRWFPDAKVVKAFNSVGVEVMVDPDLAGGPPTMPLCGNDEQARGVVAELLRDFGWEPADLGDLTAARGIEPMVLVWVAYGRRRGAWDHAFKMIEG